MVLKDEDNYIIKEVPTEDNSPVATRKRDQA